MKVACKQVSQAIAVRIALERTKKRGDSRRPGKRSLPAHIEELSGINESEFQLASNYLINRSETDRDSSEDWDRRVCEPTGRRTGGRDRGSKNNSR